MHEAKTHKRFVVSVILLSIIPIIGVVLLIKTVFTSFYKSYPATQTNTIRTSTSGNGLPVSPDDPHILTSFIIYNFSGNITKLSDTQLTLDASLPPFPLTKTTKVYKAATGGKEGEKANVTDLKKGSQIVVSASYNLQANTWYVTQITIQ